MSQRLPADVVVVRSFLRRRPSRRRKPPITSAHSAVIGIRIFREKTKREDVYHDDVTDDRA